MVWPVKTHPARSTGLESKKNSGDGENFFLDFSFYRTELRMFIRGTAGLLTRSCRNRNGPKEPLSGTKGSTNSLAC